MTAETSSTRRLSPAKVALLERWSHGDDAGTDAPGRGEIAPRGDGPTPLSLAQERLWLLEQITPGTAAYNLFFCGRLGGCLDPEALASAVDDLVERHETLRTALVSTGTSVVQRTDATRPELETIDLRDADAFDDHVAAEMDRAIHRPFDLENGPLARLLLLRGADHDCIALIVHHLVGDGSSLGIALRELSASYTARQSGTAADLPPLPLQFGDFAAWQRDSDQEATWAADVEYWTAQLGGAPALDLPTDHPRPAVQSLDGDWCELGFDRESSDRIRAFARSNDTTPFVVLLASYLTVLRRMTGQDDLTVGTALAHRTLEPTFGLIGDFINIVALRAALDGEPSFTEVVWRVRRVVAAAFAHADVPYERVVAELNPPRDTSRNAIFQTMFVMQPATSPDTFASLPLELVEFGSRTVRADLELHLWDRPEFVGRLAYSGDLFDRATAQALADRIVAVTGRLLDRPDLAVTQVSALVGVDESALATWTQPDRPANDFVAVTDRIRQHATRRPDASAVIGPDGRTLTYGELVARADRFARRLLADGVGRETRVGVCLPRIVDMIVAVLAVISAGAAYVPLDPAYPPGRLDYILDDADAAAVITDAELAGSRLERVSAPLVLVDELDTDNDTDTDTDTRIGDDGAPSAREPVGLPAVDERQLAYVIYTSGSTGRPKGVQVEHGSLSNLVATMAHRPGLRPDDVVTLIASLSFDASVAELFAPLCAGAALVVVSSDEARDGRQLIDCVTRHEVTVVQAVPTTWRLIQSAGGVDGTRVRAWCGGEALRADLAASLAAHHDEAWNLYGPTEATVWTCTGPLGPDVVSLGRPLDGVSVHVLDEFGQPVPVGVFGELHIGGANLARGYLGRPALTAQAFVADPTGAPGARLYRTGDRVRWLAGGGLEFAGRRDHQVKLRGYRIELGEIESALLDLGAVRQAAVAVHDGGRLVGHVVLDGSAPSGPEQVARLRAALRTRLPEYMIPSHFTFLTQLPTTPNGKLDRAALPEPVADVRDDTTYTAPRTDIERQVAALAAEALGAARVGVDDDFFALGGHSMTAAQLVAALSLRFGIDISVQDLFANPTVAHLAGIVEAELGRGRHLTDENERIRRLVADMSETTIDALTEQLLRTAGAAQHP